MTWLEPKNYLDPATGPGALVLALLVLLLARLASGLLGKLIRRSTWLLDRFGHQADETVTRYVLRVKTVLVYLIAGAAYASFIPALQAFLGTIVASAGITAVVVGFAAKSTLANLVSGMMLAVYRPFRIGDRVSIEGENGTVEDITLRHTIVRTWENKRLIIPNEKIDSMSLINFTAVDPRLLTTVDVGISYDSDIDRARAILLAEAKACPFVLPTGEAPGGAPQEPYVRVVGLGDSAVNLRLFAWTPNMDAFWKARHYLLESVKKRFDAEGMEIPFPHRTLVYKTDPPPGK
jgi:small-conductance mechanosensitive channel